MKTYVAGFMIAADGRVALVRKNRPDWQRGKLNGIGGKIEDGETALQAMIREFKEETGCPTRPRDWYEFCVLGDRSTEFRVHFFFSHVVGFPDLRTTTDEEIVKVPVSEVTVHNSIANLTWLIPMALTIGNGEATSAFKVREDD